MRTYTSRAESPFSEAEELELAAELLEVNSDRELDQFLGGLLRRAASAAGGALRAPLGRALGGLAKGAMRKILPGAGTGWKQSFNLAAPGGSGLLAAGARQLLGLEAEGLSAEDQEFAAAQQLVRLAGAAAAEAGTNPNAATPDHAAQQAMLHSAQRHAPGLVRAARQPSSSGVCGCNGQCSCRPKAAGSWARHGRRIVLHGV